MAAMTQQQMMDLVGPQLAFMAKPLIRNIVNQLGLQVEVVYGRQSVHNNGYFESPSPLLLVQQQEPHLLATIVHQHPAMDHTTEQLMQNFKARNKEEHLECVEDIMNEIHELRKQPFVNYLQSSDSFMHAVLLGADAFAAQLLAAPRLIKLAALALGFCQDSLDCRPGSRWLWTAPRPAKSAGIQAWVAGVLSSIPHLAKDASAFATQADQVQREAAAYGPMQLHYTPAELQQRVAMCMRVGLFNEALAAHHSFAYNIVSHIDMLMGLL